jgi:hypothetical protein
MLCPREFTYQLITLMLTKWLSFPLIGSFLVNTIAEGMVYAIFIIFLLTNTFLIVSWAIQTEIICKIYPLVVNIQTYLSRVHKTIVLSYSMVMFMVHHLQIHGLVPFYYWGPQRDLSNSLLSDPNRDFIQKLFAQEFDLPTYNFDIKKIDVIYYSMVMFRVHYIQIHGVTSSHYCATWWDLSNTLSSNPNRDRMQMFFLGEVGVPTYHFGFQKTIEVSYFRVKFRVHNVKTHARLFRWLHTNLPFWGLENC